jgi:hypothetical protein
MRIADLHLAHLSCPSIAGKRRRRRRETPNQHETAAKPKLPAAAEVFALDAPHHGASIEPSFLLT